MKSVNRYGIFCCILFWGMISLSGVQGQALDTFEEEIPCTHSDARKEESDFLDNWKERKYYSSTGELVVTIKRSYLSNNTILKEEIISATGVPQSNYSLIQLDNMGHRIYGEEYSENGVPSGKTILYDCYPDGNISKMQILTGDNEEVYYLYEYDTYGNIVEKEMHDGTLISLEETENTYNEYDQLVKSITKYTDLFEENVNKPELSSSAYSLVSTYQYDKDGRLITESLFDENNISKGGYEYEY